MRHLGRAVVVACALWASACLESPELVECGEVFCSPGYQCWPDRGCVNPDLIGACDGRAELDPCAFAGLSGICRGGVCESTRCGDAIRDPGEACDDGNEVSGDGCNSTCTSAEICGNAIQELNEGCDCGDGTQPVDQLATRCLGLANGVDGTTCRGDCISARCGNGLPDPGEVCDDGNLAPGDGCTPDCASQETCGNGILDFFATEQCDDGNTTDRDGCTATCLREERVWRRMDDDFYEPSNRDHGASVYDARRGVVVTFSGTFSGNGDAATWELDGETWRETNLTVGAARPPERVEHASAYDPSSGRTYVYAGYGDDVLSDLWAWNGARWDRINPVVGDEPAPRWGHAMAYDEARGELVVIGGRSFGNFIIDEALTFDGNAWTTQVGAGVSNRAYASAAYDPVRQRVVVVGGFDPGGAYPTSTWEWNGATWTEQVIAGPPARHGAAMYFDPSRGQIMLYGGYGPGNVLRSDLWAYTGSAWTSVSTTGAVPARAHATMSYDVRHQRAVLVGGYRGVTPDAEAVALEGTVWRELTPRLGPMVPPDRHSAAMAFDRARGVTVVYGGFFDQDVWEFDAAGWRRITPPTPIGDIAGAGMVYDEANARLLFIGGDRWGEGVTRDVWIWDGASWQAGPMVATPRAFSPVAYDPVTGRVWRYGGAGPAGDPNGDLIYLSGNAWTTVTQSGGRPSARSHHGLAWDRGRGVMVMYGGVTSGGADLDEVWEWNGSTWSNRTPTAGVLPMARSMPNLVYDEALGRVLMFGGTTGGGPTSRDTYAWNGSAWSVVADPVGAPTARRAAAATWDPVNDRLMMFGGVHRKGTLNDLWSFTGSTWTDVVRSFSNSVGGVMYLDSVRNQLRTLGGQGTRWRMDPWFYDGTWQPVPMTGPSPPPRRNFAAAYDAGRDRLVIFGGRSDYGDPLGDAWEFDGTQWAEITATGPSARAYGTMVYDAVRGQVVLIGGNAGGPVADHLWSWNGSTWQAMAGALPPRSHHASTFDTRRGRIVVFGGRVDGGTSNETWEYDGTSWTGVATAHRPNARKASTLAYDPARGLAVMVGGNPDPLIWEYDGVDWTSWPANAQMDAHSQIGFDPRSRQVVVSGLRSARATFTMAFESTSPTEVCWSAGSAFLGEPIDGDVDGLIGCADADCDAQCEPLCPPWTTCAPDAPRCGDGACDVVTGETCRSCAGDCGACGPATNPPAICGDRFCDAGEVCAIDCPL